MRTRFIISRVAMVLLLAHELMAQDVVVVKGQKAAEVTPKAAGGAAPADGKVRVYVTESDSWQTDGSSGSAFGAFGTLFGASASHQSGGARPQTAEIIKTLGQKCPQFVVNNRPEMSDYILRLDHEGGKSWTAHKNKIAVFDRRSGDSVYSHSTLSLGGSIEGACVAIEKHWAARVVATDTKAVPVVLDEVEPGTMAGLTVEASVAGADIEVDGEFMGSAPSTLSVAPGKHTITVKKKGYADWSRTMVVSGNAVRVSAEMETKS